MRPNLARRLGAALALLAALAPLAALADPRPPEPMDGAQMRLALHRLQVIGSVLYVAAHPDDENTAMLAWLARRAAGAHGLPVADARRRRPEPDRPRAGRPARRHPHAGAARGAPHRRRRAVLHARGRLRLLEEPRRDARASGGTTRSSPTWCASSAASGPTSSSRASRTDGERRARAPHRVGACSPRRPSRPRPTRSASPSSSTAAPWQARRLLWNAFALAAPPRTTQPRLDASTSAPTTRCSAARTARSPARAAACTRARASARPSGAAARRTTSSCSPGDPADARPVRGRRPDVGARPGRRRASARCSREAEREFDPTGPPAALPALMRARPRSTRSAPRTSWCAPKRGELDDVIRACAGLWLEAVAAAPAGVAGRHRARSTC